MGVADQRQVPAPTVQEAGWAPGPVRTGAENLAPTGIRSPDRPASSELLYRLRHPVTPYIHTCVCVFVHIFTQFNFQTQRI